MTFLKNTCDWPQPGFTDLFLSFVQENKNRKIDESNQASKTKPQTFEEQLVLMAGYRHKQIKHVKSHKRLLNWKLIDVISLKVENSFLTLSQAFNYQTLQTFLKFC